MLMPETMWMPVVHAVTRDYVEVHDSVCAPADWKGQESYFCSGINDCGLKVEKEGHRRLLRQLLPLSHPKEVTAWKERLDRKNS